MQEESIEGPVSRQVPKLKCKGLSDGSGFCGSLGRNGKPLAPEGTGIPLKANGCQKNGS